jgi:chromosome segregation ATPase
MVRIGGGCRAMAAAFGFTGEQFDSETGFTFLRAPRKASDTRLCRSIRAAWVGGKAGGDRRPEASHVKKEVSLDRLDIQLNKSARTLDTCRALIRDLDLKPDENIRRIGEALVKIFEIQDQIYERRPDLTPEHLKEGWNRPRPGSEAAEDELGFLKTQARAYKRLLEQVERRIGELEREGE